MHIVRRPRRQPYDGALQVVRRPPATRRKGSDLAIVRATPFRGAVSLSCARLHEYETMPFEELKSLIGDILQNLEGALNEVEWIVENNF